MCAHVNVGIQVCIHVDIHGWLEVSLGCCFSGIVYLGCLGVSMFEFVFFFFITFIYSKYVCMHVYAMAYMWNSEDNLQDSILA